MNLKMFKEKSAKGCKECDEKGFVQGTQSNIRAACLFCHGLGSTNHGPRRYNPNLITVMKWCEDYIDDKKDDGWYH